MDGATQRLWVDYFDPSQYLGGVNCPILFVNGSNDFAYPMDSYRKSYRLVKAPMALSLKVRLPHGHIWTFGEVDAFVDNILKDGDPLPKLGAMKIANGVATATFSSKVPVTKTELHYTTDGDAWQKRVWKTEGAELGIRKVRAQLPAERPLVCFLTVTDERGLTVSTPHEELATAAVK
jgi:hypothetical protein